MEVPVFGEIGGEMARHTSAGPVSNEIDGFSTITNLDGPFAPMFKTLVGVEGVAAQGCELEAIEESRQMLNIFAPYHGLRI